MHLYHFTLQKPGAAVNAVCGNFSGLKTQEILVGRNNILELLRPDENGKLQSLISINIFGVIRSILPFRLTGSNKDYIVVGSDSGRIVILEYNPQKNLFEKVHQETFGKSGCRRIVPGQYLAADPKGRAIMIGSLEKQKLVYILNRDTQSKLTISSPLEAHKAHTVIFSMSGVDVGFENPIFATIELDYEDEDNGETGQKNVVFYELDLGLNNVIRKWQDRVDERSNIVLPVPGGSDGPGGVIICAENYVYYKNQNANEIRKPIPRRKGMSKERGLLIVSYASHKQKDMFFILVQSEFGDLYKITLQYEEDLVTDLTIKYFDTVPTSNAMCVLKSGLLFVASEFSNHMLYQFQGIGEDEESSMDIVGDDNDEFVYFAPHPLRNLAPIDEVDSLSPIMDLKVADLAREETPQIYVACGRGVNSSLRVLRHGLTVGEIASQPLPGNPSAVWTLKRTTRDEYDQYIVVSFINATLVLAIGENVEEATDSGFLGGVPTLLSANIGDDSLIQIHPNGIRHIRADKRIHEWKTPGKKTITHATSNERQVVIALSGGDILYFELDQMGQLIEIDKKFMGTEVACLAVAPIPEGRQRSRFLAVGDWDRTVRIFSLDPDSCLQSVCVQGVPAQPESLCIVDMPSGENARTLFLNIGLNNGVLLRSVLDHVTGELSDTRTRFIGSRGVKLHPIKVRGTNAVMALSSRAWICYFHHGRTQMTPLSYVTLEGASNFITEQCPEGIVAISGNTLRIITIDRLGDMFNQTTVPLLHTPRKLVVHPIAQLVVTIESDDDSLSLQERESLKNIDPEAYSAFEDSRFVGEPKPGHGKWASAVRLIDTNAPRTLSLIELTENEAALTMCTCVFHDKDGEVFVVVATAQNLTIQPMNCTQAYIHVYRIADRQLQLVHKTPIEGGVIGAICAFQGRLLVGVGKSLRIYDMGKKKLLRKCENKNFPNYITQIHTQGDRIYVSDVQESIQFVKYKRSDNQLYIFADEVIPRWLSATAVLDYDTVALADKFGNIAVSRLPAQVSDEVEEDPTGSKFKVDQGYLNGAAHKLEDVVVTYTGDTVTSIQKTSLAPGGSEAIIYTTITGTIGALMPFGSREDVDFFGHLEMHLRQEAPPLCGRDHLSYRSSYFPVKGIVDGDLCEQYAFLDPEKQRQIAEELDRTPSEVMKKLEDIRNKLL